jgi:cytochrome b
MPGSQSREARPEGRVSEWDPVVRLCHWSLAALVLFDFFYDDGGWLHRVVGYAAAGIVVARLLWAAVARGASGLAALRPSPSRTIAYLRDGAPRTHGHDPIGVWMVWLLWTLVILLGITGWMSRLDAFWGDDRLDAIHAGLAQALMVAVAVHIAGVAVMGWRWRENLVAAMLTGRKRP